MLGLSVDASSIRAAVMTDGGDVVSSVETSTPIDNYRECLDAIATLIRPLDDAFNGLAGQPTGIALPGIVSEDSVKTSPLAWLNEKSVKFDLQAVLGRPICLFPYGGCFTFYEGLHGAGLQIEHGEQDKTSGSLFGMHIDTNCYGGMVIAGKMISGANGIAGNWAHLPLPDPVPFELDGKNCWCGRTGCMEAFLSTAGLEDDYFKITGTKVTAAAIATAAGSNDIVAESSLQVLEDRLGRASAAIITLLDPQVIIVGGMVSTLDRIFEAIPRKWPGYVTAQKAVTRFVPAQCGPVAAAAGAGLLAVAD